MAIDKIVNHPIHASIKRWVAKSDERSAWVVGFTADLKHVLIQWETATESGFSVAHRDTANGIGRWEAPGHFAHHDDTRDYLAQRFPVGFRLKDGES